MCSLNIYNYSKFKIGLVTLKKKKKNELVNTVTINYSYIKLHIHNIIYENKDNTPPLVDKIIPTVLYDESIVCFGINIKLKKQRAHN